MTELVALPAHLLPSVRVAVQSALLRAGVESLLGAAGLLLSEAESAVLIVDDAWLADPEALADALADSGAIVALGSAEWAALLPELTGGGWAVLSADATPAELLAGVLGAAAGLVVLPPALFQAIEPEAEDTDFPSSDVNLTPREHDVLALLVEGLSNKRAARELGVTESTIKFHVQAVYSKLGVQSRAGAVARGIGLGLVSV